MSDLLSVRDIEFRNAVKELKKIQQTGPLEEITIHCSGCDTLLDFGSFNIFITDDAFWCLDKFNNVNIWMDEKIPLHKAKKIKEWYYELILPSASFKLYFLENIDQIKKELEKYQNQVQQEKEEGIKNIKTTLKEELDDRKEINEPSNINVIDFGYRTIEIISNGSVVLIDRQKEQEKQREVARLATTIDKGKQKQIKRFTKTLEHCCKRKPKKLVKTLKKYSKRKEY